jgi:hypothetical protein
MAANVVQLLCYVVDRHHTGYVLAFLRTARQPSNIFNAAAYTCFWCIFV